MLGEYCLDRRSTRRSTRARGAGRLHSVAPAASSGRPGCDHATSGPLHPATSALKPSWPTPSKRSACILSLESHPLAHASYESAYCDKIKEVMTENRRGKIW